MASATTNAQRKSAPYIPSWPLLPPEEPYIRFCHLMYSITKTNIESIQQESKRVMTLWNELNDEERQVYYKEYEDDLETYWRLQMVICGCPTCKQAISKFQGTIDVTHFISKLNHNQQQNLSQIEKTIKNNTMQNEDDPPSNHNLSISNKDENNCNESLCHEQTDNNSIPINASSDSCAAVEEVFCMETTPKPTGEVQNKNSSNQSVSPDKPNLFSQSVNPSVDKKCSNDYQKLSAGKSEDNVKRRKRGYPFTTSNCMDLSGDESDESDEFRSIPVTLLSPDRCHSPDLAFQDSHDITDSHATLSTASSTSRVYASDGKISPECSKDCMYSEVVSNEDALFPKQVDSSNDVAACSPPNFLLQHSQHSQPSSQNQQTDLQNKFNEIKKICIDMILEKLKYLKSIGCENDLEKPNIYDINKVHDESNNLDSCLPEFAPIMNTLRRDTWQLRIENESRKVYNRKVTLKLKWTSKDGEPIQCLDSNGLRLDFRRMQPFVKLKPLKSLKTPIVLNIHGNGIYSRLERQIVSFKPKRRLKNSLRAYQMRSKENFRLSLRNKKEEVSDGPVVCDVCNSGFTEQQSLLVHRASCNNFHVMKAKFMEPIFGGLRLACPLDGRDTTDNVVKHCTICSLPFTDLILHEIHMYIAHKSSIWCCNICGFKFQNNNLYLEHMVDHQKLQCVICKNLFETTEHLNQHLKFKHQEFKRYCKKCERVLPTICLFQDHMVEHLTIRPFSCSLCSKRFKRKYNLVGHLWTHKPHAYKCVDCQLSFPRPHLLKAHNRRVHSRFV